VNLLAELRVYMNLCATVSLPGCDCDAAATALMLYVFEAVDEIGNARHQEHETESNSPQAVQMN
jgi:hypothetical protein